MKRLVLTVALAIGFAAGLAIAAVPAQADSVTYVRVSPAKGSTAQAIELQLPDGAFCPQGADRVIARLSGGNLTESLNVTGNTAIKALDTMALPGTAILPLLWTLQTAGGKVMPPVVLDGDFRLTVSCLAGLSQDSLGDSIADISIDATTSTYTVTTPQPAEAVAPVQEPAAPSAAAEAPDAEKSAAQPDSSGAAQSVPTTESAADGVSGSGETSTDADAVPADQAVGAASSETSSDEAALAALAASNEAASAPASSGSSLMQPLLIGGGIFLLVVVGLLARRARRQS